MNDFWMARVSGHSTLLKILSIIGWYFAGVRVQLSKIEAGLGS